MATVVENGSTAPQKEEEGEETIQQELVRSMASKLMAAALEEEERQRRIEESQGAQDDDSVKTKAYGQLVVVQEDLVRTLNLMKVKMETELEQAQRITEQKKQAVHDELVRKSAVKEADKLAEEERQRRMEEAKGEYNAERKKTYDKLVTVQEDLLKHIRKMKADEEMKLEQERRVMEGKKQLVQDQLVHAVGEKKADSAMEKERVRRIEELSEEEYERRVAISRKMIDVQKELLSTHKPTKAIEGTTPQEVLEEAKAYVQEQLVRKAAQKQAIAAMNEEQNRRIADPTNHSVSDAQADVLEAIARKASVKVAKNMVDSTQKELIQAEAKARAQEETVRKVNQKLVDKAMNEEQSSRVQEVAGKDKPHISAEVKKEIEAHSK